MFRALTLSIGQLGDPAIVRVLLRSLAITLALFAGLGVLAGWALDGVDPCGWLLDGSCPLDAAASGLGAALFAALAMGVLAGFL